MIKRRSKVNRVLPFGTVTFLFTDIEGSTRLLRSLGDRRYNELLQRHRTLLRAAVSENGGVEVDSEGDGLFFAFSGAKSAIAACVSGQLALLAEPWADGTSVAVRMGLHSGEATPEDNNYQALAVHQAARVAAAAQGGQVLLSQNTAGAVHEALPASTSLRDLGEFLLKDFEVPTRLFQLCHPDLPDEFERPQIPVAPTSGSGAGVARRTGRPRARCARTTARRTRRRARSGCPGTSTSTWTAAAIRPRSSTCSSARPSPPATAGRASPASSTASFASPVALSARTRRSPRPTATTRRGRPRRRCSTRSRRSGWAAAASLSPTRWPPWRRSCTRSRIRLTLSSSSNASSECSNQTAVGTRPTSRGWPIRSPSTRLSWPNSVGSRRAASRSTTRSTSPRPPTRTIPTRSRSRWSPSTSSRPGPTSAGGSCSTRGRSGRTGPASSSIARPNTTTRCTSARSG